MSSRHSSPGGGGGPAEGWWRKQAAGDPFVASPLHPPAASGGPPPPPGEEFGSAAARVSGFAAVVLGWSPEVFWRSTPAELASVVRVLAGDAAPPLDAGAVAALMREFPDG